MLRIFYGRAGTGKSAAVMSEIKAAADRGEGGYILLVPEQYSHEAERELCAMCGDSLSLYAEVLSFTGLARRISAELGGLAQAYLDKGGRLLCMALAADGLYSRLRVYSAARRRSELQAMLLAEIDELKTACVSSEKLLEASESCEGALADKLHDLGLVLEAYDAVVANGHADPTDRLTRLARQIPESSLGRGSHVYVDGFTDFTAQERRVLEELLLKGVDLTVCLGCDDLKGGSEIFELCRITARTLLAFAKEKGIQTQVRRWEETGSKNAALVYYADNMFSYSSAVYPESIENISISTAADMSAECEFAAARAVELVRETGCRWRDIAVAVRGFDDYRLSLESAFAHYGAPLYTARKTDLLSKPLPMLISSAYEIIDGGWDSSDVLDYLRTGLAGLSREECDELENYIFMWQLRGSAWTRGEDWRLHPDGYGAEFNDAAYETLSRINELRRRVSAPLLRFAENTKSADTAAGQAEALAQLLEELELSERLSARAEELADAGRAEAAQEYAQLWDITVSALEQSAAILGDTAIDREAFGRLFTLMLSKYDVGTIPAALDRVTAGDFDRMRRRNIKHLIVLGATDTRIPKTDADAGVFSAEERKRLLQMDIDLGGAGESELWREFSLVYNCLTLPSESLSFCIPAFNESGEAQRPAFVVNRAKAMFGLENKAVSLSKLRMNAAAPAMELAAHALRGGGVAEASAEEYFADNAPGRLEALRRASELKRGSLSRDSVRALYGDKIHFSASRIDKFASCRFAYFMRFALGAKPREPAGFTAPEMGVFMHYILERVARDAAQAGGYKNISDDELRRLTDKYIAEYVHDTLNDFREKSKRFEYLFRRLTKSVHQVVLDMANELRSSDFEPLSFELDFGKAENLPPLQLGEGEDSLVLTGIADRVDGWLHEGKLYLRVVDYKTGSKRFELSDVLYGMNLQMLLYLFSLSENGRLLYGSQIVPAGVLYIPAKDVVISSGTRLSDEALEKERSGRVKRSGLILDNPGVINAMEHGEDPKYIPVKFKNGVPQGDALVSAERLGLLARHIDDTLRSMAAELRRGSIAADPYYRAQQECACANCDYVEACRFTDGENGEHMRPTPRLAATKVWNILEGGGENG